MKKKILLSALIFALLFTITACTETNGGTVNETTTTASAENGDFNNNDEIGNIPGLEDGADSDSGANSDSDGNAQSGADSASGDDADAASVEKAGHTLSTPAAGLIGWGLGKERDSSNRPADALSAQGKYGGMNAVFIDVTEEKKLYLTFDEGYENGCTVEILDILLEKGATATFFVTYDYCKSSPELVRRMIDEGHIVGNHSYTHTSFPECSVSEVTEEIIMLHDHVKSEFGYEMSFIRFPKGEFSEKTLKIAQELGYTTVFWSFAHVDWETDNQPTAKEAFDRITSATHKGAVYLLHAVSQANTACLSDVLDYWSNNGYRVASLSELSQM